MTAGPTADRFTPFDADGGLVFATRLPGSAEDFGPARPGWEALGEPADGPPLWVHLDRSRGPACAWIRERAGLDPLVADALLAEETRPRADAFGDGLVVILRGINLNPGADPDELISVRLWATGRRVITVRQFRFATIADLRTRAQAGRAPATPGALVGAIALGLALRMEPSLANLADMLDGVEEAMLDGRAPGEESRRLLATVRRQAIAYRRHLVPQRDALASLAMGEDSPLDGRDRAVVRSALDRTARACEALEELRDRAAVTQDELRALHESGIGRRLYVLTVVATVMLPLGFVTGLMGMNVGGLPLSGSGWGFGLVCLALAVLAGVQVWVFRRVGLL